jgi:hypothetical protein
MDITKVCITEEPALVEKHFEERKFFYMFRTSLILILLCTVERATSSESF